MQCLMNLVTLCPLESPQVKSRAGSRSGAQWSMGGTATTQWLKCILIQRGKKWVMPAWAVFLHWYTEIEILKCVWRHLWHHLRSIHLHHTGEIPSMKIPSFTHKQGCLITNITPTRSAVHSRIEKKGWIKACLLIPGSHSHFSRRIKGVSLLHSTHRETGMPEVMSHGKAGWSSQVRAFLPSCGDAFWSTLTSEKHKQSLEFLINKSHKTKCSLLYSISLQIPKKLVMLEGKLFLLAGLARKKWYALFSSFQDSYCVNKVLLIPSGWLCRKTVLAKLLVWVKVILLKTAHNCFSLSSLMLSTGNSAKFESGLGVLHWQEKLTKGKEFSKCRGNLTWHFFEPASVFLTLLWREWEDMRKSKQWEFNGGQSTRYSISWGPQPWSSPWGTLSWLSSSTFLQRLGTGNRSWHWKQAWDSLTGKGGAAFHPWECSSAEHRMINNCKREGNTLKELQI